jgi:hypothetical protein
VAVFPLDVAILSSAPLSDPDEGEKLEGLKPAKISQGRKLRQAEVKNDPRKDTKRARKDVSDSV